MNRNVLVFGATGKTGIQICKQLELNEVPYSVFVREKSAEKISHLSGKLLTGDVLNEEKVKAAIKEKTFSDVVIALGSKDLKALNIRSRGTKNIIDVLNQEKSKTSLHVISALGVGNSWGQLKWPAKLMCKFLINNTMKDHNEQERIVQNSSLPYHIIRPVGLKDGPLTGKVHVQNEGFLPRSIIQRADVAKFLVDGILDKKQGISGICQQ